MEPQNSRPQCNSGGPDSESLSVPRIDGATALDAELIELKARDVLLATYQLRSERCCVLKVPNSQGCDHQFLVYFPSVQGVPTSDEKSEMRQYAADQAERLAKQIFSNAEAYMLVENGEANRRANDFHIHIFVISGEPGKVFQWLADKNSGS